MNPVRDERPWSQYTLAVFCVFALGVAIRLVPLYWTPYPFNPDGFVFAGIARDTLASGSVLHPSDHRSMELNRYVFVVLLVVLSRITGLAPLWLAQPVIAVVGAVPPIVALLLVRNLGLEFGWPPRRTLVAATLAGFVLAIEGLYLRRTVTVSYEVLGLLLVPVVLLCVHRFFETSRRAWIGVAGILLLALPATHHFSTVIAAVSLTVLVAVWIDRRPSWLTLGGLGIAVGFWLYLLVYYARSPPGHSEVITTNPALVIAWLIAIIALAHWFRTATPWRARGAIGCIVFFGFGVLSLNAIRPIFPGTAPTPSSLLVLVAPLMVLAVLATWGLPIVIRSKEGPIVLTLLIAPLTFIGLGLTAGLSLQYDFLVMRTQTFVHLGTVVIAAMAVFVLYDRVPDRPLPLAMTVRVGLPLLLILVAVVTVPIAFAGLETLSYQGTTTEAEFSAVTFASTTMETSWSGDDHITRIDSNYYGSDYNIGPHPVYEWLQGGDPPPCPVVAQDSWTTVGAQLYPAPPEHLDEQTYADWQETNNAIYVSGESDDQTVIVVPTATVEADC